MVASAQGTSGRTLGMRRADPTEQDYLGALDPGAAPLTGTVSPTDPTLLTERSYISALTSGGQSTTNSFWADFRDPGARKWETGTTTGTTATAGTAGGTVYYYIDPAGSYSAAEVQGIRGTLSLWSAVANIQFVQTTTLGQADFSYIRNNGGYANAGPIHYRVTGTQVARDLTGTPGTRGSLDAGTRISIDPGVQSFSRIDSLTANGGYGTATLVHEEGHILGLGHGANYDASQGGNYAAAQNNQFDSRQWTTMSYISPSNTSARFYNSYSVTGTNWGSSNGIERAPTTWMPLDILAVQQLYGVSASGPLNVGQTFGFNTTLAPSTNIRDFFDFTVNTTPVVTLYDTARGNTLDLSGYGTASTIDLRDGHFSSA
ncbi:hypothetical protein ACFQ12_21035, partial [Methylobacterium trifolii]